MGHSVHFGPIRSILSTLILFGQFCPFRSYSVQSFHFSPIQSDLVKFGLFFPLRSYLVHLRFYSVIFCPFGPFGLCWFILVYLDIFLCIYIMEKDMFGLKAPNLNPNLLKNIVRL